MRNVPPPAFAGSLQAGGVIPFRAGAFCRRMEQVLSTFLLARKYYHPCQDNLWAELAEAGAYEAVDWDCFYKQCLAQKNGKFCSYAAKAGRWDVLAKYRKRWFLFGCGQFRWWLKSFA
ncbi:MAG: hypothetical protein ACLSE6_06520 [Alphaproteobacteria bacterium]